MSGPMDATQKNMKDWEDYAEHVFELESAYERSTMRKRAFILICFVLLGLALVLSVSVGAVNISFFDSLRVFGHALFPAWVSAPDQDYYSKIILGDRLSRSILCIMSGFSLAVAGAVMQNILRNPLVSPFTLGVSSAASFGAAVAIMTGSGIIGSTTVLGHEFLFKNLYIAAIAFAASMLSISLVLILARRRDISRSTIILTGVIISYLFQAGVSSCKYFSDDSELREIVLWLLGGMWNHSWGVVYLVIPVVMIGFVALEILSVRINVLSAGDEVASNLGVNVPRLRMISLVLSTLITSITIAFTGIIGFIGLMAPHLCRLFIGNDSRYLFPAAGVLGALIILVSDTVARIIVRPEELPVGIVMYVLGGIFFIWLVTRRKKEVVM